MEVRNGQTQSRVVMAESGSSKLCIPPQLIGKCRLQFHQEDPSLTPIFFVSAGISNFLKHYLTQDGLMSSGCNSIASYTRKLISKSCSR